MDEQFLLRTDTAQRLYHQYAADLPVIDYHNHLSVADLAADRRFDNLAQLWLVSDPYKHRAMRICGVPEEQITGKADVYEKFAAWCGVVPQLVGNPLYHWSQLELSRVFGIDIPLNPGNAREIWDTANRMLQQDETLSARGLLKKFGVEYAAPCCMITEDITPYTGLAGIAPAMRGDGILPLTAAFVKQLDEGIATLEDLRQVFDRRLDAFHQAGCRFADHSLDDGFCYLADDGKNDRRFAGLLAGEVLDREEQCRLNSHILRMLGTAYGNRGWVMELHMGALRYTSSRLRAMVGPAGGFAGIGSCNVPAAVALLDDLEKAGALPRTILFTLNPADNAQLSILSGSFAQDGIRGKVQQGAAWWWCDHLGGMRGVLDTISEYGVLSVFLGMTTDSRSLLSFVRHEYFRRVLCGWIGEKVESGLWQADDALLGELIKNICYQNVKNVIGKSHIRKDEM